MQMREAFAAERKIGPSKRVAKEVLDGMLGRVARREYLGVIDDSPIAFSEFANIWLARIGHNLKPTTRERFLGAIENHLKPRILAPLVIR